MHVVEICEVLSCIWEIPGLVEDGCRSVACLCDHTKHIFNGHIFVESVHRDTIVSFVHSCIPL